MSDMNEVLATVRTIDGRLVLDDPDALAVMAAVGKRNCSLTLEANRERVAHFARRAAERGDQAKDVVIVLIAVDDRNGRDLAAALMPGHSWQQYRDRGELPYARGLAGRDGVQGFLDVIDEAAGERLRAMGGACCVVVIDYGVAEVFAVESWHAWRSGGSRTGRGSPA